MKKIYTLIAFLFCLGVLSAQITEDFEDMSINTQLSGIGWSPDHITAEIVANPYSGSQGNVLQVTTANYNAAPVLEITLEAGTTLSDYNSLQFQGYFASGDIGWKTIYVEAYPSMPTGQFANDENVRLGEWERAKGESSGWEAIDIPINQNDTYSETLSGTIYIAFGISANGTMSDNPADEDAVWHADDVTLSPVVSTFTKTIKTDTEISTAPGNITIASKSGSNVAVYSLSGAKVFNRDNAGGKISVNVAPGLYIVVVDNTTTKVMVN